MLAPCRGRIVFFWKSEDGIRKSQNVVTRGTAEQASDQAKRGEPNLPHDAIVTSGNCGEEMYCGRRSSLWSHANAAATNTARPKPVRTSEKKKRPLWEDQPVENQGNMDTATIGNTRTPIVRISVNLRGAGTYISNTRGWQKPRVNGMLSYT